MTRRVHRILRPYGLAVLVSGLAFLLTRLIHPWVDPNVFPLLFVAVMISAWYGGLGPGLLTTLFGTVAVFYFFSISASGEREPVDVLSRLNLFVVVALLINLLTAARKNSEEALTKERDFITAVIETTSSLVVVLDPEGRIVRFNRACEQLTGYAREEVLGKPVWDLLLVPEEVETVKAVFADLRAGQFPNEHANSWVTRDGRRRVIVWSNTVLLDSKGAVEYVIATGVDVTERQRAEEERAQFVRAQAARAAAERLAEQAQEQAARLRALHGAGLALTSDLALEKVLQRVVDLSRNLLNARYGALGVIGEDGKLNQFITSGVDPQIHAAIGRLPQGLGLLGYLMRKGEAIRVDDIQAHPESVGFPPNHPPMKTLLGIPLHYKGQLLGDLYLAEKAGGLPFDEKDEELLQLFGAQAAAALANASLAQRIEGLAVVEERQRFAMDLHDGIIQSIYAIGLVLQSTTRRVDEHPEAVRDHLATVIQGLDEVIQDIRGYIANLGPGRFGGKALSAGLTDLARAIRTNSMTQIRVAVEEGVDESLAPGQTTELFHIAREALTNIVKHARASLAEIRVEMDDDLENVIIVICDNGHGFFMPSDGFPAQHRGLRNMKQRLAALGGTLQVQSAPGQGTTLRITVPAFNEVPLLR